MMIELVFAFLLGIAAGVVAGIVPGVHPNLFASLVMIYFYGFDPLLLSVFLLCSGIANSFVSFIPSIFLGAPESESSLSVLPGHKLLLQGRAYEAVKLTVIGGVIGGLLSVVLIPLLVFLGIWYEKMRFLIALGLIGISVYMLLTEKKKILATYVFVFSGIMGLLFLNFGVLFPVFTGFFALPLLFLSFIKGVKLPEKISFECEEVDLKAGSFIGLFSGVLAGMFPGIGSAQASTIAQELIGKRREREFLVSIGSITTVDIIISVFAIYLIGNPRSGIAQVIMKVLGNFSNEILIFLILITVSSIFLSSFITIKLAKSFVFWIRKIDYTAFSRNVLVFLLILVTVISGLKGLLICLAAFFLGLITNLSGIKRTTLMGFLILPTVLFYLGV